MQLHIIAKSATACTYANITQSVDNVNVMIKYNLLNALATQFTLQKNNQSSNNNNLSNML